MKNKEYFIEMFKQCDSDLSKHYEEFWTPKLKYTSQEFNNMAFNPKKVFLYNTIIPYVSKSLSSLYSKNIDNKDLFKLSDTMLGIGMMDELIDGGYVSDYNYFKNFVADALYDGKISDIHSSPIYDALFLVSQLGKTYDYSNITSTMLELSNKVYSERTSKNFSEYHIASKDLGTICGNLLYELTIVREKDTLSLLPESARSLMQNYVLIGNLFDNLKDFESDQKSLNITFSKSNKLKLATDFALSSIRFFYNDVNNIELFNSILVMKNQVSLRQNLYK